MEELIPIQHESMEQIRFSGFYPFEFKPKVVNTLLVKLWGVTPFIVETARDARGMEMSRFAFGNMFSYN